MPRWMRWLVVSGLVCIALAVAAWFGLRKALHHQPSFYVRALSLTVEDAEAAGIELEKEVLSLHNQVRRTGRWQVTFGESELNGWLAVDLPNKFPKLLPKRVSNPRIALRDDELLIAFQNETDAGPMVVSVAVQISMTSYTNEVALRVKRARIGALPLPLSRLIQQVSNSSRKSGVKLRWTEQGGDPVALLTIAPRHPEFPDHLIQVDELKVSENTMQVSGVVVHVNDVVHSPSIQAPHTLAGKLVIPLAPNDPLRARVGRALMDGMPQPVTR